MQGQLVNPCYNVAASPSTAKQRVVEDYLFFHLYLWIWKHTKGKALLSVNLSQDFPKNNWWAGRQAGREGEPRRADGGGFRPLSKFLSAASPPPTCPGEQPNNPPAVSKAAGRGRANQRHGGGASPAGKARLQPPSRSRPDAGIRRAGRSAPALPGEERRAGVADLLRREAAQKSGAMRGKDDEYDYLFKSE